jgi:hypothetical protein
MTTKQRRSGLASSGLDAVIPTITTPLTDPPAPKVVKPQTEAAKVKFGGYIDPQVAEQARDALYALGGSWTAGALIEGALRREIDRLATEHTGGNPSPTREQPRLRTGPRIT